MRAYIIESVEGEILLAFRTDDIEELHPILTKLKSTRNKELKRLAGELEEDYNRRLLEKSKGKRYNR